MELKLSSLVITLVTLDLNRILILFSVMRSCCWLVVVVKCRFRGRLYVIKFSIAGAIGCLTYCLLSEILDTHLITNRFFIWQED